MDTLTEHRALKVAKRCGKPTTMLVPIPPEERRTVRFVYKTPFGDLERDVEFTHRQYDPPGTSADDAFFEWVNALDD